jgi:hypothetical protein
MLDVLWTWLLIAASSGGLINIKAWGIMSNLGHMPQPA